MSDQEWQIEMLWRCTVCDRENRGHDKICENCTAPKKESDPFYMPGSTGYDDRVTDADRITDAKAGADWSCRFCESAQRNNDGTCARCGVDQATGRAPAGAIPVPPIASIPPAYQTSIPPPSRTMDDPRPPIRPLPWRQALIIGAIIIGVALLFYFLFRTKDVRAAVADVAWAHSIQIDRYRVVVEDGFDPESDAFNIRGMGERIRRHDHRLVGSHDERYQAREACGQTCVDIPRRCGAPTCTNNKNGYASCKDNCTGGGRDCSTKYCNATRTRRVDDYQDVPIYAPYYAWDVWRWAPNRTVNVTGTTLQTRWPDTTPPSPLASGEREREARTASYAVIFKDASDSWTYHPSTLDEFGRYEPGQRFHLKVNAVGGVEVVP
jgi:hypothetical protein